jgi:hypothetical protein
VPAVFALPEVIDVPHCAPAAVGTLAFCVK